MLDRRHVLAGGAGLLATPLLGIAPTAAATTGVEYPYDYLLVEVPQNVGRGAGIAPFVAHLTGAGVAAVREAGGDVLGYFTPLIGSTSEQVAVMIRWPAATPRRERAVDTILRHPSVSRSERMTLAPTLRPGPTDRPITTGIYTHRWFTIRAADVDEFVNLSAEAWPDFERDFATRVFGLFRAEPTAAEAQSGRLRMLLNTQYDSHAVWEASRLPSPKAADRFRRRAELTITTQVVSLKYTPVT